MTTNPPDDNTLDRLADALGYDPTDPASVTLDIPYPDDDGTDQDGADLAALATNPVGLMARATTGVRTGQAATDWARGQIVARDEDYEGQCLRFTRLSFNVWATIANAGLSWDLSPTKHHVAVGEDAARTVPGAVPFYWETTKVEDHVAPTMFSVPGFCISTDVRRPGWPDIIGIHALTLAWRMVPLGWTEGMNDGAGGPIVYVPETPDPGPKPPTRVSRGRDHVQAGRRLFRKAVANGRGEDVAQMERRADRLLKDGPKR